MTDDFSPQRAIPSLKRLVSASAATSLLPRLETCQRRCWQIRVIVTKEGGGGVGGGGWMWRWLEVMVVVEWERRHVLVEVVVDGTERGGWVLWRSAWVGSTWGCDGEEENRAIGK